LKSVLAESNLSPLKYIIKVKYWFAWNAKHKQ